MRGHPQNFVFMITQPTSLPTYQLTYLPTYLPSYQPAKLPSYKVESDLAHVAFSRLIAAESDGDSNEEGGEDEGDERGFGREKEVMGKTVREGMVRRRGMEVVEARRTRPHLADGASRYHR